MLPVLVFSLLCRANEVTFEIPPDSVAVVRASHAVRTVRLPLLGRTLTLRLGPRAAMRPVTRDSVTTEAIAAVCARDLNVEATARSVFDVSPRLRTPAISRGAEPLAIEYGVGAYGSESRLEIYDVTGRRLARMPAGAPYPGRGTVQWRCPSGSGVYFVRLVRPDAVLTRRVVRLS